MSKRPQSAAEGKVLSACLEEKAVVGAVLCDPEVFIELSSLLTPSDFESERLATVWRACAKLDANGEPIDPLTIRNRLLADGCQTVTAADLATLAEACLTTANVTAYAKAVKAASVRRAIRDLGRMVEQLSSSSVATESILSEIQDQLISFAPDNGRRGLKPWADFAGRAIKDIEMRRCASGEVLGLTTGFPKLDKELTGLHPGELIVIGARTSVGKTTIGLNMALNAAKAGHTVAVFSLEMTDIEVAKKLIASGAKVIQTHMKEGLRDPRAMQRAVDFVLQDLPIYIDDRDGITVQDVRTECRRLAKRLAQEGKTLDLVFVDYLQIMRSARLSQSRYLDIQQVSMGLKGLAKELKCPVIVPAQLSREVEKRHGDKDAEPRLSDLRESGAIEQDADVVLFLWRNEDTEDTPDDMKGRMHTLKVAKQRNGPRDGKIQLWFDRQTSRFLEADSAEAREVFQ